MKKDRSFLSLMMIILSAALIIGCSESNNDPVSYKVTQGELDLVAGFIGSFTGGNMAHGGPDGTSADSTTREVYSSVKNLDGSIPVGTIVTKKTYKRGSDGKKTDLLYVSFAMVKREAGYNLEGGDWEYVMMPFDNSVDYTDHPYGLLPVENTDGRGKLGMCMACHATAGGSDYLFVND